VLREFRTALGKAFREFQLVAGDTGAYGQDIGSNVVGLLRAMFAQEGKFRLTIMDFNPEWLIAYSDQLIALFAEQTHKMRFISIPIQSGSDRILRLMRRRYTASQATECLCGLKEDCPEMCLNTHVMVGFPTETDEDFDRTIQLLRRVRFDRIEIFRYCDRPNTATSLMNDKVSRETIEGRVSRLRNEFPH
jgi:tRNA A37 methylthiotransferase MiaB